MLLVFTKGFVLQKRCQNNSIKEIVHCIWRPYAKPDFNPTSKSYITKVNGHGEGCGLYGVFFHKCEMEFLKPHGKQVRKSKREDKSKKEEVA